MANDPLADIGPEARYRAFLEEGKFMIQRGKTTGAHVFYPRTLMPRRGDEPLEWVEASGLGEVYSTTTVRRRETDGGPYNVAIIELEEGPRTMSRVVGCAPDEVRIGLPVRARIGQKDGVPILFFEPSEGAIS